VLRSDTQYHHALRDTQVRMIWHTRSNTESVVLS